ncbi:class I SAM-dependent methyltransferase [Deinococcus radiomollis]|uniref:class I SAM-dependent methyltransferase n=1 Tax=Deinococcus radiomollis TaxID=468916 RepID=UPI003892513F
MNIPEYDSAADFYVAFVDRTLNDPGSSWHPLLEKYVALLKDRLSGACVLDIACGEGHLSRLLSAYGPREIIGIDLSSALIKVASERTPQSQVHFRTDDARVLSSIPDASVDIAVSKLAVMDIPDHQALFSAVYRVLVPNGVFVFSLLHPCFETPFHEPEAPQFIVGQQGESTGYAIREYVREGHWNSGGTGVRGKVGAYHRTLSTLINDLLSTGFVLRGLYEPVAKAPGLFAQVPRSLLIHAQISN